MSKQDLKHQLVLSELVGRLLAKNRKIVGINQEYCRRELCGEVDVLAVRKNPKIWYFYEVKSCHNSKTYHTAIKQFERFKRAYPNRKVKGIFVSPEYTWRM